MRHIKAQFSFFKAGQGLFYGGRIWNPKIDKVFIVVYDCGTSTFVTGNNQSLNNEIEYFKLGPNCFPRNNEIELLFISHLDYDHVSGLKRLLTEFEVKNIILPYIKEQRQFFLVSMPDNNDKDSNLTVYEYIEFIESPNQFILRNSGKTQIFFVKPNSETEIEYLNYDDEIIQSENAYPRGTLNQDEDELTGQKNVKIYNNNLQFFLEQYWEFTTYCQTVNQVAIDKLHTCLKKKLKIKLNVNLTFDDLKNIVTRDRKKAHKCYTDNIDDINSHGLVLLHGPIRFEHLCGSFYSNCELKYFQKKCCCYSHYYDEFYFNNNTRPMLGTLLFGDTSINPNNNPIDFPKAFKDKLVNTHVVQVPHHGSSKNWDYNNFKSLNIGKNIYRWRHHVIAVCNFGFGNRFGHPSHQVLSDLNSTLFLNSQFTRLNIQYEDILY